MAGKNGDWGGKRVGAGRPKGSRNRTRYGSLHITGKVEDIEMIKDMARKEKSTVSRLIIDTLKKEADYKEFLFELYKRK